MIESEQNPKVRLARALQRRRDRERHDLIFIEGLRLIEDALASGSPPAYLFYTAAAHEHPTIASLAARHTDVAWEVSEPIMESMTDTVTPQGIAAIVPLPHLTWPDHPTLLLITDRLRDPGNLGTLLRTAAAAGVEGVLLVKGTVDAWSDKVLRAGMGAHFRLPLRSRLTWKEILPLVDGLTLYTADANAPQPYDEVDWRRPSALVIGSEAHGPSEQALTQTTHRLAIPMANEIESLNAAMAGGVILFEAYRQRRRAGA